MSTRTWILSLVLVGVAAAAGVHWIYKEGQEKTQAAWDLERQQTTARMNVLQGKYDALSLEHSGESTRIANALKAQDETHKQVLAGIAADAAVRLRSSEDRAAIYQRQAQGGAAQCGDLASYAAQLDRALEQGRSLEREYRETLGLRDQQIILLGSQIKADRKVLEATDTIESTPQ